MAAKPAKPPTDKEPDKGPGKGTGTDKSKIIVFALMALALLAGSAGTTGTLYYLGYIGGGTESSGRQVAVVSLGAPEIIDFPELMVDLKTGTCRAPYVRFRMAVEAVGGARGTVTDLQPQIIDAVQQRLRSMERQELVGVEGADHVRNEAREVINRIIAPERVNSVIFKKFVLQ